MNAEVTVSSSPMYMELTEFFGPKSIVARKGSELFLLQKLDDLDFETSPMEWALDIEIEEGAKVHHVLLLDGDLEMVLRSNLTVQIAKGGSYQQLFANFGRQKTSHQMVVEHLSEDSSAKLYAVNILDASSQVQIDSKVIHRQPNSTTEQLVKSVLTDTSRLDFAGKIRIERVAQKTNCVQLAKSILLSDKAQVTTRPELEILADDVKAKHGATVGQLMPEEVFYLQSRGFPLAQAKAHILNSFFAGVLEAVESKSFRDLLNQHLQTKLQTSGVQNVH